MTRSPFLCALALSLLLSAGTTHAFTADVNLWPLMVIDGDDTGYDVRFLVPFGQFTNQDGKHVEALRPLYIRHSKEGSSERSLDLLWPLANVKTDSGGNFSWRAFPFFYNTDSDDEPDFTVFPLFWTWWQGGSSDPECGVVLAPAWAEWEKGERDWSCGIIPVYAQWRDGEEHGVWLMPLLWNNGRHYRTMAVFPLFFDHRDDDSSQTWLAPVYWGRDGGRTKSFVVFPLFWRGRNSTVLFPVYWDFYQASLLMVPPFYGRQKGEDEGWFFVLFPSYLQTNELGYRTHRVLWPLLTWGGDDKGSYEYGLWPLYGKKHEAADPEIGTDGGTRAWAMFPFFWTGDWTDGHSYEGENGQNSFKDRQRYVNVFPFLWVGTEHNTEEEGGKRTLERESKYLNVFPILWCRSSVRRDWEREQPDQRLERKVNVFPLFWSGRSETLVIDEADEHGTEVFWRGSYHWLLPLYTYNADENSKVFTAIWPLWRSADTDDMDQYSILWRLMDARFYPNGDHRISVLWRGFRHQTEGDALKVDMFPFITYRRPEQGTTQFQFLEGLFATGKEDDQRFLRLFWLPKLHF